MRLPSYVGALDDYSSRLQRREWRWQATSLALLCFAALAASISAKVRLSGQAVAIGPTIAGFAFLVSFLVSTFLIEDRIPERERILRRLARQIESEAWRFSTGADRYSPGYAEDVATRFFVQKLLTLLDGNPEHTLASAGDSSSQVTESMMKSRQDPLPNRVEQYRGLRLKELIDGLSGTASRRLRQAMALRRISRIVQALAIVFAISQALQVVSIDLIGTASAIIASILAWLGATRIEGEAVRYETTVSALRVLSAKGQHISSEGEWSGFVDECETRALETWK